MKRVTVLLSAVLLAALVVGLGPDRPAPVAAEERGLTFELYKDAKEEFRWRLKAGNGQIIATSGQGYKDKRDCHRAVEVIQAGAAKAKVEEVAAK